MPVYSQRGWASAQNRTPDRPDQTEYSGRDPLHIHSPSHADDLVGGLWAVIATAFVFRTTEHESITAAKTRVAATALSFALCLVYLLLLPSHTWGLAVLVGVSTFLLISLGQSSDVGVAA